MKSIVVIAASCLLILGLLACSGADPIRPTGGNLNVYLTDAPIDLDNVVAVNVTLGSLTVFPVCVEGEDCSPVVLDLVPGTDTDEVTLNLLEYRDGKVILMASEEVPEGDYERIRMQILAAVLVEDDDGDPDTPDVEEPIKVPSGKVDVVVPFTISAGEDTEVVLDFDAALSVHLNETGNGKYILRPVINGSAR